MSDIEKNKKIIERALFDSFAQAAPKNTIINKNDPKEDLIKHYSNAQYFVNSNSMELAIALRNEYRHLTKEVDETLLKNALKEKDSIDDLMLKSSELIISTLLTQNFKNILNFAFNYDENLSKGNFNQDPNLESKDLSYSERLLDEIFNLLFGFIMQNIE